MMPIQDAIKSLKIDQNSTRRLIEIQNGILPSYVAIMNQEIEESFEIMMEEVKGSSGMLR